MAIAQMIDYYYNRPDIGYINRHDYKGQIAARVNRYRCSNCKHIIELSDQQDFSYCMHCGAKVKILDKNKIL